MAAYIYQFYEDVAGNDPLLNRRKPILPSIASLRRFRPNDPIYVIDGGLIPQDWTPYQHELDFHVIESTADPLPVGYPLADGRSMERLWILTDQPDIEEDVVVSVSANIVFLDDPEPLDHGDLDAIIGGDREGMIVYRRSSPRATWMLRMWQGLCLNALRPGPLQRKILEFNRRWQFNEQTVLNHWLYHERPDGWDHLPENVCRPFFHLAALHGTDHLRSVCLTEGFVGFDKVQIILGFRELYDAVSRVSWISKLGDKKSMYRLEDLEAKLEVIRGDFVFENEEFFRRHDGVPLWRPQFDAVYRSGRKT